MNDLNLEMPVSATLALSPEQRACLAGRDPMKPDAGNHRLRIVLKTTDTAAAVQSALQQHAVNHPLLATRWLQVPGFRGWRQTLPPQGGPVRWVEQGAGAPALALEEGEVLAAGQRALADGGVEVEFIAAALALDPPSLERLAADVLKMARSETPMRSDVGYEHYVQWRQDMAADEDAAQGRAYWQHPEVDPARGVALHLGLRGSLAAAPAQRAVLQRELSVPAAVQSMASQMGQPLEFILQGLWWALLGRLSGQHSFVGGWQHDCRSDYEHFEHTLGVFEKTLPVRIELDPQCLFADWLQQAEARLGDHLGWQEYCPIEAPASRAPWQAGFAFEQASLSPAEVLQYPSRPAFDLLLRARTWGQALQLTLEADASRYSEPSLEAMLEQLCTLLHTLPADGAIALCDLEPVGVTERSRLLSLAPGRPAAGGEWLTERLARHARETPHAIALSDGHQRLDYAALQQAVLHTAGWLQGQGVEAGQCVAIETERSLQAVVHLLAILSVGAYYLPLEPAWPAQRREALLMRAAPTLVLCHAASSSARGPWPSARLDQAGKASPQPFEAPQLGAQQLAYLLFTSGSTGSPKGVLIEHGALRNYAQAAVAALGIAPGMRLALTSPLSVDLGHTVLFGAFQAGAELVVATSEDLADGAAFGRFLTRERPDLAKFVPSHLAALLEACQAPLPGTLVLGGEPTPRRLAERLFEAASSLRLFNHYGPTETTVGVLYHPVEALGLEHEAQLPLSRVLEGNRIYLLDERRRLVPTGAVGELYIGGAQVCRGYLGVADEERFIDDPLLPGERLYRSGDLGRYRAEGGVQLVGRQDHQVKVRGQRIELGEVEAALLALPGVAQAVARLWSAGDSTANLVGYVVFEQDATEGTVQQLSCMLAERLPEAMCPARLIALPSLPRLPNGKLDRQALPDPGAPARAQPARAPTTELEGCLREAMAELLGCAPAELGVDDDFFAAGGHSLLVIRLVAQVRALFKLEVPPGLVFDYPSVAGLAVALGGFADPARLEKTARLRRELGSLSEEQRAALRASALAARNLPAH